MIYHIIKYVLLGYNLQHDVCICNYCDYFKIVYLYIYLGDIVLIGLRDFEPSKADVIHKYNSDEARSLQQLGELPANAKINTTEIDRLEAGSDDEVQGFTFEEQRLDDL